MLAQERAQISESQQLQLRIDAMAMRLGEVNARAAPDSSASAHRDADIDSREFNPDREPPRGGSAEGEGVSAQIPDLPRC
jgi:hypothetical protein